MEPVSLTLIETKILDWLISIGVSDGTGAKLTEFDVRKGLDNINRVPAICVAIESIGFRELPESIIEWSPNIFIYTVFQNQSGESARRRGVYPIVEGIIKLLSFQDLDLDIDPIVPTAQATEIVHQSFSTRALIGYQIPFKTSFDVTRYQAETEAVKLIQSGVKFFCKPGDDIEDYENQIDLTE